MALETIDPTNLQVAIDDAGGGWTAGVTSVSQLSGSAKRAILGATFPDGYAASLQGQVGTGATAGAGVGAYPAAFDLTNVNGSNYITSVKDQGGCGSCVAFGTTATVEGTYQWLRQNPNAGIDLSEAQLFYCGCGNCCESGWWPDNALNYYKNPGVADEACFPYTAGDQPCKLCSDWQNRVLMISAWHNITNTADMKTWISTRGPLSACFIVYNDFFSYVSGIYKHVSGDCAGGHCICIVGYDDNQGCWKCKNSWSSGWGEKGFFRIAYGQGFYPDSISSKGCGTGTAPPIDANMWAVDGIVATGWENNRKVLGLWTIDQDYNAWAYFDGGVGWRKISPDNDNIFFDMLNQLAAAKAAGRTVSFYEVQGVIKQIYCW
jgi:C1A family cysteine protease